MVRPQEGLARAIRDVRAAVARGVGIGRGRAQSEEQPNAGQMINPLPDIQIEYFVPSDYPDRSVNLDSEREALKAGDAAGFQSLVQGYHLSMFKLAMTYVGDRGVAEDVVQEAWLTCLRSLDRFEGRSSLKTWLFGILVNVARARRRQESRILAFASFFRRDDSEGHRPTVDRSRFGSDGMWSDGPHSWDNIPESKVLGAETLQHVRSAIDALPPKQREVILLRDVAGVDATGVSSLLGISAAHERGRLHRARATGGRKLEEDLEPTDSEAAPCAPAALTCDEPRGWLERFPRRDPFVASFAASFRSERLAGDGCGPDAHRLGRARRGRTCLRQRQHGRHEYGRRLRPSQRRKPHI